MCSGTACHRLRGGNYICVSRCSGHVADTPVGEIPGYAQLPPPPGWRKCSPLVIVSADSGGQTLRCANRASACNPERQRGGRHYTAHGASVSKQSRGLGVLRGRRLRQPCAASASRTKCSHTATMFLGAYLWHAFLIYCTDPGTTS